MQQIKEFKNEDTTEKYIIAYEVICIASMEDHNTLSLLRVFIVFTNLKN